MFQIVGVVWVDGCWQKQMANFSLLSLNWNTWRLVEMDGKPNLDLFVSIDLTCISMDFP